MNKKTYYTHNYGFGDRTAYLVVENDETKIVLKNGETKLPAIGYPPELCESYVNQKIWKKITAAEAEMLLDKKPTTFTLDARAKDVLLDEICLDERDLGTDFVSLIYRIQEAGIAKGEVNAKRIMENCLDNI